MAASSKIRQVFHGIGFLDKALAFSKSKPDTCVYGQDLELGPHVKEGAKKYIATDIPFTEFMKTDGHYYETMNKNMPLHLIFDVDECPEDKTTPDECFDWWVEEYEAVRSIAGLPEPKWVCLESFKDKKHSLHIMDAKNGVKDMADFKRIYNVLRQYIPFDASLAKNNGMCRAINQSKIETDRPLRKLARYSDVPDSEFSIHSDIPNIIDMSNFQPIKTNHDYTIENLKRNAPLHKYHQRFAYIVEHLPYNFAKDGMAIYRGIACAKSYGSRELAHAIAAKCGQRSELDNIVDSYYDRNLTSNGGFVGEMMNAIKKSMTPEAYKIFIMCMPTNETIEFNPQWPNSPNVVRVCEKSVDIEGHIKDWQLKMDTEEQPKLVFVASRIMTGKSQGLRGCLNEDDSTLMLATLRMAVNDYRTEKFSDFMHAYNDAGVPKTEDNLINTVNSLLKYSGHKDVVVLDEVCAIVDTLTSSNLLKDKHKVWKALTDYIADANTVVCMDALLTPEVVAVICEIAPKDSSYMILVNDYQPTKGRDAIIVFPDSVNSSVFELRKLVLAGKRVVVPTLSKKFGDAAAAMCKDEGISVCYMYSGSEQLPASQWPTVQVVIYTPTITYGISQNAEYFDVVFAYFTNTSAPADAAFQMLGRARNLKSNSIIIHFNLTKFNEQDETYAGVVAYANSKLDMIDGLQTNYVHRTVEQDAFFHAYSITQRKIAMSRNNFAGMLKGYLDFHGYNITDYEIPEVEEKVLDAFQKTNNMALCKINTANAKAIIQAPLPSDEQYQALIKLEHPTDFDKVRITKRNIANAYGTIATGPFQINDRPDMVAFIMKFGNEKRIEQRWNNKRYMMTLMQPSALTAIEKFHDLIRKEDATKLTNQSRLGDYPTRPIKQLHVHNSIIAAKFDEAHFRIARVPDYDGLRLYYKGNQKALAVLWPRKGLKSADNKDVMTYFSSMWKEFGFELARATRHKNDKTRQLQPLYYDEFRKIGVNTDFAESSKGYDYISNQQIAELDDEERREDEEPCNKPGYLFGGELTSG